MERGHDDCYSDNTSVSGHGQDKNLHLQQHRACAIDAQADQFLGSPFKVGMRRRGCSHEWHFDAPVTMKLIKRIGGDKPNRLRVD